MENGEPNNNVRNNIVRALGLRPSFDANPVNHKIIKIILHHLANRGEYFRDSGFILPRALSDISRSTMRTVAERRRGRKTSPTCIRVFHDKNSSPKYHWLLPGWLCEERTMQAGRLYRYFYSPDGKQYDTKSEVQMVCNIISGLDLNKPPNKQVKKYGKFRLIK